jgi:hypothetical protein
MNRTLLVALLTLTANSGFATLYQFIPSPSLPIIGDPIDYKLFSVLLDVPNSGAYTLTVQTNYGFNEGVVMPVPGNPSLIPPFAYGSQSFGMSDFLMTWNNRNYGLVLSPHDGYSIGLYQLCFSCNFETSGEVMGIGVSPRPNYNVYIAPGSTGVTPNSTLIGNVSSLVVGKTGNGTTSAMYTIVETFNAPAGFLQNSPFGIEFSSYVCANSYVSGDSDGSAVPEAGTMLLTGSVLLWIGSRRMRRRA